MFSIEWDKKFEVGNFEIDSEHKIFVKIIQKVFQAQERGEERFVELLLFELLKYAEFHFCSEENIMLAYQYPGLLEHKQEHERVLAELRNRIFSLQHAFIDFVQLEAFLIDWFTTHTITEDSKIATYINNQHKEEQTATSG